VISIAALAPLAMTTAAVAAIRDRRKEGVENCMFKLLELYFKSDRGTSDAAYSPLTFRRKTISTCRISFKLTPRRQRAYSATGCATQYESRFSAISLELKFRP
jgi:hypothetical protein